jgi:murein DD-endopeptidase MepM/ murein hydrolase activator NlpD
VLVCRVHIRRLVKTACAASLIVSALVGTLGSSAATPAASHQSLSEIRRRMAEIQAELDAATRHIEHLRTQEDRLRVRLGQLEAESERVAHKRDELQGGMEEAAANMYKDGGTGLLEVLLSTSDLADLLNRLEILSRVAQQDRVAITRYARAEAQLRELRRRVASRVEELAVTQAKLGREIDHLQTRFQEVTSEYNELKRKLAEIEARRAARRKRRQLEAAASPTVSGAAPAQPTSGQVCPVAGPNSFIDSWGYPRSGGRSHEGTDIMAAEGTPVVAIVDGTITYAGYGSSAGNWIILSGRDGNSYWYLHNQENLVSGGGVSAGQQIATVGNTGNASGGAPHVHFEYHPGGGGPVNPYPLLVAAC